MTVLVIALMGAAVIGIEALRWTMRPEQRRLRMLKKIGGRP